MEIILKRNGATTFREPRKEPKDVSVGGGGIYSLFSMICFWADCEQKRELMVIINIIYIIFTMAYRIYLHSPATDNRGGHKIWCE